MILDRKHPKFWHGKVRVSETVLDGVTRYMAEWRSYGGEDWWWKTVTKAKGQDEFFPSLALAQLAAKHAWDNDESVARQLRRKVWP